MRPILDFDDAGAGADHPARGVTVGDIRSWHDEHERLRLEVFRLQSLCGSLADDCERIIRSVPCAR